MEIFNNKINSFAHNNDTDVLAYFGKIKRNYDDLIIDICRTRKLRKNVLLVLATRGGDPDAGYRIARCLQEAYKTLESKKQDKIREDDDKQRGNFSIFIDGLCKSAGSKKIILLIANWSHQDPNKLRSSEITFILDRKNLPEQC